MAAAFNPQALKHKVPAGQSKDEWTVREKLTLASSVLRSGDQNWVSVSRAIKPVSEAGCCTVKRPPDFFSQKNCAIHYSEMLEKVSTPKRKRTNETGGAETPGEQIVRKLTFERIEELKKSIKNDHLTYRKLKMRIDDIRNGKLDAQLPAVWEEIQARKRHAEEMQSQAAALGLLSGGDPSLHPSHPLSHPAPMSAPVSIGLKQGNLATPSPQKGKQLRIPKPTPKFQKYQEQLQQRHGQGGQHLPPSGHALDPSGIGDYGRGSDLPGISYGSETLKSEPMDIDPGAAVQTVSIGNVPGTPASMVQTSQMGEAPTTPGRAGGRRSSSISSQGQSESSLFSLLAQPPKDKAEMDHQTQKDSQDSTMASAEGQLPTKTQASPSQENSQTMDGKSFLGVTSPMEAKKLDSIRDRIIPASSETVDTPSISAPTLSKLLSSNTQMHTSATTTDKSGTVMEASVKLENNIAVTGRAISVGGSGHDSGGVVSISVNPKVALVSNLPTPIAITPPPTTPPAEKKTVEVIPDPLAKRVESIATEETSKKDSESSSDLQTDIPEIKVDVDDTPQPSPRVFGRSRAPKPGRPGRPPRVGRRSQRHRSKSLNSTDNENEADEEKEEDTKSESIEAESEKTSEKDEEDIESTISEKKDSDDEEEQESADDGYSESGLKDESFLDRASTVGSESVPASPASQISQGDDMESAQAQKTWRKSIMLVWRAAANHKYANVFLHPVTDDEAPGYHTVVFRPMDLSTIKKNIENGSIRTTSEFQRDMMLMFQNALMYNSSDHDVFRMAEEMRDDVMDQIQVCKVMDQIQSYIATQLMVQSSDRDSKMLRGHRSDVFHFFL
ncbi:bromodomain-containing protein 8 isoform X3 [Nematostella vectensis]|uniref:bromodomain-containing protein 8 isoform X3 n=1 Tax=Nematostella vectensis TaxID=45351 RepID=UPI002077261A|nr:bromodomain-containing protein 8 isoform X3 [Nematostella vectensis]